MEVHSLRKVYGSTVAVDEISSDVRPNVICGLLGRNGAGKTATIECIEGLREPDGGERWRTSLVPGLNAVEQVKLLAHLYRVVR